MLATAEVIAEGADGGAEIVLMGPIVRRAEEPASSTAPFATAGST